MDRRGILRRERWTRKDNFRDILTSPSSDFAGMIVACLVVVLFVEDDAARSGRGEVLRRDIEKVGT